MNLIRPDQAEPTEFAEVFHRYKNLVYRAAYSILGDSADAEDALQEVFVRVYDSLASYDASRGAFSTWLYRITVNTCLAQKRRKRAGLADWSDSAVQVSFPEDQILESAVMKVVIGSLSDKLRAVVFLRYYAQLSYTEIADVLDIPTGTVQSRLNQAMTTLRRMLGGVRDQTARPAHHRQNGVE